LLSNNTLHEAAWRRRMAFSMRRILTLLGALWAVQGAFAQSPASPTPLPAKEKFYLFLLVGQSNMAGRGQVEEVDKTPHARVLVFNKQGEWAPAVDPLHFDKRGAGVGIGKTFGTLVAEADPSLTVGLIPCAVGGSPIDSWIPGALDKGTNTHPWDDCMQRAQVALQAGTLKGILWHQGESDANPKLAAVYEGKLHELIARFRKDLNAPDVPFIAGQLGQFEGSPWSEGKLAIDKIYQGLPAQVPHTAIVSSAGLRDKGDKTHFDAASYREFGKRYFEAYQKLVR